MLKCGMAEVDITPLLGMSMPGQWHDRKATGINDNLYAKAMVVDNNGQIAVLIALDAIAIARDSVAVIRKYVSEFCGIAESWIMVSATHTHTGGPVLSLYSTEADNTYIVWLARKATDAAVLAYGRRRPAVIGYGVGSEQEIVFNRRYFMKDGNVRTNPGQANPMIVAPAGPVDPAVTVMRIDDMDGHPIGVVTNFACHLDVIGGTEYSADYPGVLSRTLKKALGQNVVSVFLTGTCGDINHVDVRTAAHDKHHYEKMGIILAGEVLKTREKIVLHDDLLVDARMATLTLETRKPSDDALTNAAAVLMDSDNKSERNYAKELLAIGQMNSDRIIADVQVIRIGELAVTGLPGEIFVALGLDLKQRSSFNYNMVNELANGCNGYIPTQEAFTQSGQDYETKLTTYSRLGTSAGQLLVKKALELIHAMA